MAGLCLPRKLAFAGAACARARHIFAICHGASPVGTFDDALAALWEALRHDDMPAIATIFRPLTELPESSCNDTLSRDWVAWLAIATFEFPSRLVSTRLPVEAISQCSALMLTLAGDLDHRLGWSGKPREGRLARAEWAAQERCFAVLSADPLNPEIPVDELVAAGAEVGRVVGELAVELAEATGWKLDLSSD
jgi:hypothetical protein